MAGQLQLRLSPEVHGRLSTAAIDELGAGRGVPAGFTCSVCQRRGDARVAPASVVLWTGRRVRGQPALLLELVHAGCGPSRVRPVDPAPAPGPGGGTGEDPASRDTCAPWP